MNTRSLSLAAALTLSGAAASSVQAQSFVGLNAGGLSLSQFNLSGVAANFALSGTTAGESLIDIDFRPQDNILYGMGTSGILYRISFGVSTATAVVDVAPPYTNTAGGAAITFTPNAIDFNPDANRLRVFAGTSNFRLTPAGSPSAAGATSDGTLTYLGGPFAGQTASLDAAAYINNDVPLATPATVLYSIDADRDYLVLNTVGPQFSTLVAQDPLQIGGVGATIDFDPNATGFDVFTSLTGTNTAYVSNGNTIYIINLNSGAVGGVAGDLTLATTVTGATITDIAVQTVPEPSSAALFAGATAVLGLIRRRQRA